MIRVVVDTNVLVSGLRNHNGNEARVIDAVQIGIRSPCVSDEIFREYVEVLARRKFAFLTLEVEELLETFRGRGEFFEPASMLLNVPDQADAKFIACAMAARADYLITGNRRHFPDLFYGSA